MAAARQPAAAPALHSAQRGTGRCSDSGMAQRHTAPAVGGCCRTQLPAAADAYTNMRSHRGVQPLVRADRHFCPIWLL